MSLDDIRAYYGVPAYRGARVKAFQQLGVITGSDGKYIRVRLDGKKHALPFHPTVGITYITDEQKEAPSE